MSTRSGIGMEREDGTVAGIYCHWDGYPAGVGATLQEHYLDAAKVAELVSLGNVQALGHTLDPRPAVSARTVVETLDDLQAAREKFTTFYGRDCGEKDTGPGTYADVEGFRAGLRRSGVEFLYLFAGGRWSVSKPYGRWRSLFDVLAGGVELLVEPDPDRGPDLLYWQSAGERRTWFFQPSSSTGRTWLEERYRPEDGTFHNMNDEERDNAIEWARRDGLIVEEQYSGATFYEDET
jgi:hypothetical protein